MPGTMIRNARRPTPRGFTIAELLVVLAVIAILAGVAVWSMTPNTRRAQMSDFAEEIQYHFKEARGRALLTRNRHAVKIDGTTVQWCEDDCPPNQPSGKALGRVGRARGGAKAMSYVRMADIGVATVPTRVALGSTTLYFYGDGTADSDRATPQQEGFTVYLQHANRTSLRYRVAVMPLSGDIRVYDSW